MGCLSKFIVFISLILTFIHEISLIADVFVHGLSDFERLCEDIPMVMAFYMISYEFYNIVKYKSKIENLINTLEENIKVHQPTYGRNSYKKSYMGRMVDTLDKLGLLNISFGVFCAELWVIRPLVTKSGRLPFGYPWFPFDMKKYYYYFWFLHLYVATLGTFNSINIHIFYAKIMAVICEQFDVLAHAFRHIDEDDGTSKNEDEEEIYKRARKCVAYHQKILKSCEDLQSCISGIMVCQFCFGISLCFAALATFSMNSFSGAFINLLNHIFLELSELYIFCYFANKVTDHGQKVKNGIFYGEWYKRSPKTKKLFRFIIMRCDKPVVIKAGNLITTSIGSYIWILQQSYSYFMVLRSVRTK